MSDPSTSDPLRRAASEPATSAATETTCRPAIIDLADIGPADRPRVGNKAWHLSVLTRARLPIPPGFCIAGDSLAAGASLAITASGGTLGAGLQAAILGAYRALGAHRVAVRSSAADEDADDASAAGRYATFLNVRGEAALIAAVLSCWRSRTQVRAQLGRDGQALPALAVIVQAQVDAEAAGILFTCDPLAPASGQMLVNATWGLGEPLAAGQLDGDLFRLGPDGRLQAQAIGDKPRMLTAGGEQEVPPGRRRRPSLTPPQLRRLAQLAQLTREHLDAAATGRPLAGPHAAPDYDIEFAVSEGRPVLLQARRVVAVAGGVRKATGADSQSIAPGHEHPDAHVNAHDEGRGDARFLARERQRLAGHLNDLAAAGRLADGETVWSSGNIGELLPTPSTFSFGLFCHIFAGRDGAIARGRQRLGYRFDPAVTEHLFVRIGGQPYFNLLADAATFSAGITLDARSLLRAVREQPAVASYPELNLYPGQLQQHADGARHSAELRGRMLGHAAYYHRAYARLLAALARRRADVADLPDGILALRDELRRSLHDLRLLGVRFVIAARIGFFFAERLRSRAIDALGRRGERLAGRLLQGLPASRITRQAFDLAEVAEGRRSTEQFMRDYGHMSRNELELLLPRHAEVPETIAQRVAELRASGRQPAREHERQQRGRQRCERLVERLLAGDPAQLAMVREDLWAAHRFLPLREDIKYHLAAGYARVRAILRALAGSLQLDEDALFHLHPGEVLGLPERARGTAAAAQLSARRAAERQAALRLRARQPLPAVLFASDLPHLLASSVTRPSADLPASSGTRPPAGLSAQPSPPRHGPPSPRGDAGPQVLPATPIAAGHREGTVRLVALDEAGLDEHLASCLAQLSGDEIIVAPAANLGLAPLFRAAAGVIVEVGGILAHSACQAREAGIPALVLPDATRRLRNGDRIRLDTTRGAITILARAGNPLEASP